MHIEMVYLIISFKLHKHHNSYHINVHINIKVQKVEETPLNEHTESAVAHWGSLAGSDGENQHV